MRTEGERLASVQPAVDVQLLESAWSTIVIRHSFSFQCSVFTTLNTVDQALSKSGTSTFTTVTMFQPHILMTYFRNRTCNTQAKRGVLEP